VTLIEEEAHLMEGLNGRRVDAICNKRVVIKGCHKGLKREVNVDEMENGGKEKIENEELMN
jgi:hypothetical protein